MAMDIQYLVDLLGKSQEALQPPTHDDELTSLRSLILDMGRVIRSLDEDHQHLEFWAQDGDYVLDGRFRHE